VETWGFFGPYIIGDANVTGNFRGGMLVVGRGWYEWWRGAFCEVLAAGLTSSDKMCRRGLTYRRYFLQVFSSRPFYGASSDRTTRSRLHVWHDKRHIGGSYQDRGLEQACALHANPIERVTGSRIWTVLILSCLIFLRSCSARWNASRRVAWHTPRILSPKRQGISPLNHLNAKASGSGNCIHRERRSQYSAINIERARTVRPMADGLQFSPVSQICGGYLCRLWEKIL